MKYVVCNLCGYDQYVVIKKIKDYCLVKCKRCGLVYLNPRPDQDEIKGLYSSDYHKKKLLRRELKTKEDIEMEISKCTGEAEEIISQFGNKKRLLDIGCGAGFFIAYLKRKGLDVTGIDISEWCANFAKDKLGVRVLTGRIEEIEFDERFDIITMYHILEHLPDPLNTLKKVYNILKNDGFLIIKGPNFSSFDRLWHGINWRGYDFPYHLYHFTPDTYQRMLETAGFYVEKIKFQYWDLIAHLIEARLGDGIRTDHPPDMIRKDKVRKNFLFKAIDRLAMLGSRILGLKGRDLTIYAKKKI